MGLLPYGLNSAPDRELREVFFNDPALYRRAGAIELDESEGGRRLTLLSRNRVHNSMMNNGKSLNGTRLGHLNPIIKGQIAVTANGPGRKIHRFASPAAQSADHTLP